MKIFYQSLEDFVVTTDFVGTQFPVTNLNNRNSNIKFIPDVVTTTYVHIYIDVGSGNTITFDHVVFGKVLEQGVGETHVAYYYSDNGSSWTLIGKLIEDLDSNSESDILIECATTSAHRYWSLMPYRDVYFSAFELGNIFLGTTFELAHNPELESTEVHGYLVESNEAKGGEVATNLLNTKKRQTWEYVYAGFDDTEKANIESFISSIKPSDGASQHPFFFEDTDGNLHFVRQYGEITFKQIAYNAFECTFNFKTEF